MYAAGSLKVAEFLFSWVQETIDYKQYASEVLIGFEHVETYGNDYLQVSYRIGVNDDFKNLNYDEKERLFRGTPTCNFTLSTNTERVDQHIKMLRILEFKHIYESLAANAVLQFEKHLIPGTSIKVKGIDMWPDANYAERYLLETLQTASKGRRYRDLEADVFQWGKLHQLANDSKTIYSKGKKQFNITDIQISRSFGFDLDSVRSLLLRNAIPIKIRGAKTIDEIRIHTGKLVDALKNKLTSNDYEYSGKFDIAKYKALITYLYDTCLPLKKAQIVKQQQLQYLKDFVIQKSDIMQLKNSQVVIANTVQFDEKNSITVEYVMLNRNLERGQRMRTIAAANIEYFLKDQDFLTFKDQTPVKRLSLLEKWMAKRKLRFDYRPFEPDLAKDMDIIEKM